MAILWTRKRKLMEGGLMPTHHPFHRMVNYSRAPATQMRVVEKGLKPCTAFLKQKKLFFAFTNRWEGGSKPPSLSISRNRAEASLATPGSHM